MSNAFQKEMVTVSKSHLEAIMDYLRDHEFDDMIQHIADGGSHENHIYGHVMALDIELDQHTLIDGVECHNDSEIESQLDKLVNGD